MLMLWLAAFPIYVLQPKYCYHIDGLFEVRKVTVTWHWTRL